MRILNKISLSVIFLLSIYNLFGQFHTRNVLVIGRNAIYFDNYIEAINNFNNIIRVKPNLPDPYFYRAVAKLNLEDYIGAKIDCSKAIQLHPSYTLAYIYRGVAFHYLKDYNKALEDYEKALLIEPNNAICYANRAMTYAQLKKTDFAIADYSKAISINPKILEIYLNRSILWQQIDSINLAFDDCNTALKLNPFSEDVFITRGYLYFKEKDYYAAINDYTKVLKIDTANTKALMHRALAYSEIDNTENAINDLNKVIKKEPYNAFAYFNRAMLHSKLKNYNLSLDDFTSALEQNPDNILIYFNRGITKNEMKDFYGAIKDFTKAIEIYPDFVKAFMARAYSNQKIQNFRASREDISRAESIMDKFKNISTEEEVNQFIDTTKTFRELIDINAKSLTDSEITKGKIQNKNVIIRLQNNFNTIYANLEDLPEEIRKYDLHIMQYNMENGYEKVFGFCNIPYEYEKEKVLKSNNEETKKDGKKTSYLSFFNNGIMHHMIKEYPVALQNYNTAINQKNDFLLALFNRANLQAEIAEFIARFNVDPTISTYEGNIPSEQIIIDYSTAISDLNKVLEIDNQFDIGYFNRANLKTKSKNFNEAIKDYNMAITINPNFAEAYFNRGLVYIYLNKKIEAYTDLSYAGELGLLESYNIIKRYCNKN